MDKILTFTECQEGFFMPDYKSMYCLLCSAADKSVSVLKEEKNVILAAEILEEALLRAENIYVDTAEE